MNAMRFLIVRASFFPSLPSLTPSALVACVRSAVDSCNRLIHEIIMKLNYFKWLLIIRTKLFQNTYPRSTLSSYSQCAQTSFLNMDTPSLSPVNSHCNRADASLLLVEIYFVVLTWTHSDAQLFPVTPTSTFSFLFPFSLLHLNNNWNARCPNRSK